MNVLTAGAGGLVLCAKTPNRDAELRALKACLTYAGRK